MILCLASFWLTYVRTRRVYLFVCFRDRPDTKFSPSVRCYLLMRECPASVSPPREGKRGKNKISEIFRYFPFFSFFPQKYFYAQPPSVTKSRMRIFLFPSSSSSFSIPDPNVFTSLGCSPSLFWRGRKKDRTQDYLSLFLSSFLFHFSSSDFYLFVRSSSCSVSFPFPSPSPSSFGLLRATQV